MKNPDEKVNIVFQLVKRKACEVSDSYVYGPKAVNGYCVTWSASFFFLLPHMVPMVSTPAHRLLKN